MANSYKDIIITPNKGSSTNDPTISFRGADASTDTEILLRAYPLSNGTLSFEGSEGQLFAITNELTTGSIFSVNDVSGIPSIDVDANGTVSIVSYGGSLGVGTTNPSQRLHVSGNLRVSGAYYDSNNLPGTSGQILQSIGSGTSWTTNLSANNLTGTIPSSVLGNSTLYVGTTAVALNRASANQTLTGINSITFPGATSGSVTLLPNPIAGTTVIQLPATSGTVITSGDTGTVTNTMLAGSIQNSKLVNSTISGVSLGSTLGTLTLNTSGIGLTGSASYNGSTGIAFTVTSNATSSNTANTIVSRDASGNFSAGTITATLTGTASSAVNITNTGTVTLASAIESNSIYITQPGTYTNGQPVKLLNFDWYGNLWSMGNVRGGSTNSLGFYIYSSGTERLGITTTNLTFNTNTVWHAGNDGVGSTLDADLLDGQQGSYYTTAGNLTGTIPSSVLGNSTLYVGTTAVALNRASANQILTGISSITLPGAISGSINLVPASVAGVTTITLPSTSGTVITSGDTGTVTSEMIANNTIVDGDIAVGASIAISKLAANTISGVSLGSTLNSLTLNTSGIGLTGSASYNGSAGVTFTVTSNATNTNTANAIVSRDSSGNFNAGIITASQFSTGSSGSAINITSNTLSGPSEIIIDPSAVGDNTGSVRIRGDLFVDGTQTVINSSTIELADFNVGIATTVSTNSLLDGAGIGIGATSIRKTLTWDNANTALRSSENFNLASGKVYEINGTEVLSSTTLGSGIVNSSLTSVGTLNNLNVSGVSTISVNSSSNALRITQIGTGNALVVEDDTNPDATPFVVTSTGDVGIGTTNPQTFALQINAKSTSRGIKVLQQTNDVEGGSENILGIFGNKSFWSTNDAASIQIGFGRISNVYVGNNNWDFRFLTGNSSSPTEKLRINAGGEVLIGSSTTTGTTNQILQVTGGGYFSGSVGIGTTNPRQTLSVVGGGGTIHIGTILSTNSMITLNGTNDSTNYNILSNTAGNFILNRPSGNSLVFARANSIHASFDSSDNLIFASGNVAIGNFTPSYALDAGAATLNKAARIGSIIVGTAGNSYGIVGYNAKPSALNAWQYDVTDVASWIQFLSGSHVFYRAISGTGGNSITPLESARFDSSGNLLIGSSSATGTASQPLQVTGGGYFSNNVGIGITLPTSRLSVSGDGSFTGVITALTFNGQVNSGVGTITTLTGTNATLTNINGTNLNYSGISSVGSLSIGSTQVISSARQLQNITSLDATTTATIESAIQNAPNTFTDLQVTGLSTFTNGPVLVGSGTSTGTTSQRLQVTGGGYFSNNVGIGTTNPQQNLHILGNLLVAAGSSTGQYIVQRPYEVNGGTLSWEGSSGQLFSITNNLSSGSIFSVNDISGIPSIDVNANGTVSVVAYGGNLGVGTTSPTSKLSVIGDGSFTGVVTAFTLNGQVNSGVGTVTNISGTNLNYTGVATFANGPVLVGSGTSTGTTSQRLQVTGGGYFSDSVGIGTTVTSGYALLVNGSVSFASSTQSLVTNRITKLDQYTSLETYVAYNNVDATITWWGGLGSKLVYNTNILSLYPSISNGIDFGTSSNLWRYGYYNSAVFVGSGTSTGTIDQKLQVTGGAYVSGNLGIGSTNPGEKLDVSGGNIKLDSNSSLNWGTSFVTSIRGISGPSGSLTLSAANTSNIVLTNGNPSDFSPSNGVVTPIDLGRSTTANQFRDLWLSGTQVIGASSTTGTVSQPLQVTGGGYFSGSVGIGTTNPQQNLHILGNLLVADVSGNVKLKIDNNNNVEITGSITAPDINELYELDDISSLTDGIQNTFALTYNTQRTNITDPFKLLVTVNGVMQSSYTYASGYVFDDSCLASKKGYTIDSDGNIKFTESVPSNSEILIRTVSGKTTTNKKQYPFNALDMMLS